MDRRCWQQRASHSKISNACLLAKINGQNLTRFAHSKISNAYDCGMRNPCQSLLIDVCKTTRSWHFGMGKPCQILLIDVSKKTCLWYFRMGRPLLSAASIDFSLFFSCEVNIGSDMWIAEMHNHRLFWMFSMNCQACVFDCNVQEC